jgi:hypothetical protein
MSRMRSSSTEILPLISNQSRSLATLTDRLPRFGAESPATHVKSRSSKPLPRSASRTSWALLPLHAFPSGERIRDAASACTKAFFWIASPISARIRIAAFRSDGRLS